MAGTESKALDPLLTVLLTILYWYVLKPVLLRLILLMCNRFWNSLLHVTVPIHKYKFELKNNLSHNHAWHQKMHFAATSSELLHDYPNRKIVNMYLDDWSINLA